MKFMLTEVKVLTNLIQTETCLREANDDDYADIYKWTQTLERIAEKLGNKHSWGKLTQLLLTGINKLHYYYVVSFNTICLSRSRIAVES